MNTDKLIILQNLLKEFKESLDTTRGCEHELVINVLEDGGSLSDICYFDELIDELLEE